jgi:cysteine synthase
MMSGSNELEDVHAEAGVFAGPDALRAFLNPENHPPLPLVELPDRLNPLRGQGVRIFGKLMYLLPLLSIKSLPALNMLLEAAGRGDLDERTSLVESSSGNTAFSMSVLAGLFGVTEVVAMVPWDIAPGKLDLLRLSGAEPHLVRAPSGPQSGISQAREAGRKAGWFNPGQYENPANPAAAEKWIAPEVWNQTRQRLRVFATGLGTTGTLVGVSRYFRGMNAPVRLVGVICDPESAVPGVRSEASLREIGFPWREAADAIVEARTRESFKKSLELCRVGLMAGPSSGFALAGLLRYLEGEAAAGRMDALRNGDGEVLAVFVCADTPLPYLDKYSTHLDPGDFA